MTTEAGDTSQNPQPGIDPKAAGPKTRERDPFLSARDALLADMDAKIEARREQEQEEFLSSSDVDPKAWLLHRQMQAEARGQALETETPPETNEEPTDLEDGTDRVEPMAPVVAAPKVAKPAERISTKGEDPLGEYVVRKDGKPMMKLMVYGQEKLVPLEVARAELQKIGAGDERLRQAAARQKELDARAEQLRRTEAELASRASRPTANAAPVDDDKEAIEIVRSLVTDTEDKAAARLAKTLKAIRQAPQPQVDVDAIAKRAAEVAEQKFAERETNRALQVGFETFTRDYRDIASDPELFAIADGKTDGIAAEHPEWSPGEVMLEAGRQTHAWMQRLGMKTSAPPVPPISNRQQRKEGLRPMPTPRTARTAVAPETDGRQSPSDVMAEIRKSRGQAS